MTYPSITLPAQATGRALRVFIATLTVVLIATVAFMVGRVTTTSISTPTKAPVVSTQLPATNNTAICEQVGHFRSAGC